jgi:hypothetical protein
VLTPGSKPIISIVDDLGEVKPEFGMKKDVPSETPFSDYFASFT